MKAGRVISGVRGVVGHPWIWSKQSSHTRETRIGEDGDSNSAMGTFRGGVMNSRLDVSSSAVKRDAQALQKMPPHLRQCYSRSVSEDVLFGIEIDNSHVCAQRWRKRRGRRSCHSEQLPSPATYRASAERKRSAGGKHTFQRDFGRRTARCSLGRREAMSILMRKLADAGFIICQRPNFLF